MILILIILSFFVRSKLTCSVCSTAILSCGYASKTRNRQAITRFQSYATEQASSTTDRIYCKI